MVPISNTEFSGTSLCRRLVVEIFLVQWAGKEKMKKTFDILALLMKKDPTEEAKEKAAAQRAAANAPILPKPKVVDSSEEQLQKKHQLKRNMIMFPFSPWHPTIHLSSLHHPKLATRLLSLQHP
jgi:hypothetical protein